MTDVDQTPPKNPKSKGKPLFIIGALATLIVFACGLNYSNSQKRAAFKEKVEKIIITDTEFVKKNDCWLLDQKPNEKLNASSVQFFSAKSSDVKNFHYKCADDRGYESNVYIGSQDSQYLDEVSKQQLKLRLQGK